MALKLVIFCILFLFGCIKVCKPLNNIQMILYQLSQHFEFDCVSIISDGETTELLKFKQLFQIKQVQLVRIQQLETIAMDCGDRSQCTYFMFAQNQSLLQNLLNGILSIEQKILNLGSWFIVSWEVPEINAELRFDSDVTIVMKTNREAVFDLVEMYDLGNRDRITRNFATLEKGLEMKMGNRMERRKDLMGKHFRYNLTETFETYISLVAPGALSSHEMVNMFNLYSSCNSHTIQMYFRCNLDET